MEYLDIIGIGAINFDYIFFCKKLEYRNRIQPEFGQEYLNGSREGIYEDIDKLLYTTEHTHQLCGSALFAVKTAHAICPELKTSYVGVCGKPTKRELDAGFNADIKEEFSFLYNTEWLFFDEGDPGIALVRIVNGTRNWIDINTGVNSKLQEYIEKKEKQEGIDFADFLSNSKWIHLSSLSDFSQFNFLIQKVKVAKEKNPLLRVSIDPGYEYTKDHKMELRDAFSVADYVFLNNNELENLIGDNSLSDNNKYNVLSSIFNNYKSSNTQVIIIKSKDRHTLASFNDGKLIVSNYWHRKMKICKIQNDTGAGDAFAGGFIASMLTPRLLVHQPMPIHIGAVSAMARMKCKDDDPFSTISHNTRSYINDVQNEEVSNYKQLIQLFIGEIKKQIQTFIIGIITGVIGSLIVWWIQWLSR